MKKTKKKTAKKVKKTKKIVKAKRPKKVAKRKSLKKTKMPASIIKAQDHFAGILQTQIARVRQLKKAQDWIDYTKLKPLIIGIIGGDGIGPYITGEAQRVLEHLLKDEVAKGKIDFRVIEGLTIERRSEVNKPVPDEVLTEIKKCHV
ncbi:MAG: hypothetical protein WBE28_03990, partial [bacterium]